MYTHTYVVCAWEWRIKSQIVLILDWYCMVYTWQWRAYACIEYMRVGMAYQSSMSVRSWLMLYGLYTPMTCAYTHVCVCMCVCVCVCVDCWLILFVTNIYRGNGVGRLDDFSHPARGLYVCECADHWWILLNGNDFFLGQGHLPREWRRKARWFQSSGQRPLEWWCMCALHLDAIVPVCACVFETECMGVCACVWLCAGARYTLMPLYLCVCACVREREQETEREREIE